jgi:hypothetical protein
LVATQYLRAGIDRWHRMRDNCININSRFVSLSDTSRRTADVADALAPTAGTYLMIVYSVFKEQSAVSLWLHLNCTVFMIIFL